MAHASFPQLDDVNLPGFVFGTRWSGRVGVADTGNAQHSACEIHGMGCRNPRRAVCSLAGREPQPALEYLRTICRFADLNSPRRFGVERQRHDLSWCSLENARDLLQRFILLHTIRVPSITPHPVRVTPGFANSLPGYDASVVPAPAVLSYGPDQAGPRHLKLCTPPPPTRRFSRCIYDSTWWGRRGQA